MSAFLFKGVTWRCYIISLLKTCLKRRLVNTFWHRRKALSTFYGPSLFSDRSLMARHCLETLLYVSATLSVPSEDNAGPLLGLFLNHKQKIDKAYQYFQIQKGLNVQLNVKTDFWNGMCEMYIFFTHFKQQTCLEHLPCAMPTRNKISVITKLMVYWRSQTTSKYKTRIWNDVR